jgi:uncharacterized phage protein gp47/JayE
MEWTASEILEELKKNLRNEDSRIEGSFTMDNLQAVSEVLAMYNGMLIRPLWDEIDKQIEQVVTSGNENHYVFWAKQVEDSSGKKVVGNARAYGVRDGSGVVYVALITPEATAPSEETIHLVEEYIKTQRPVGAKPIIRAAEAVEVTIQGIVELQDGIEIGGIQTQVQKAISEYLSEVAFSGQEGTVLNYHRIGLIIGGIQGVKEIVDYTVNDQKDSLTATYSQFFKLKGLTLNVNQ